MIVIHSGSWRAGEKGATAGVIMPGINLIGAGYFQGVGPGVAMDRAETTGLSEVVLTPAGEFRDVLMVEEATRLEPGVREFGFYDPGFGLVQGASMPLVTATAHQDSRLSIVKPPILTILADGHSLYRICE